MLGLPLWINTWSERYWALLLKDLGLKLWASSDYITLGPTKRITLFSSPTLLFFNNRQFSNLYLYFFPSFISFLYKRLSLHSDISLLSTTYSLSLATSTLVTSHCRFITPPPTINMAHTKTTTNKPPRVPIAQRRQNTQTPSASSPPSPPSP